MTSKHRNADNKQQQLDTVRVDPAGSALTTQQGVRIDHTDDSLSVGERGPTLLEDFHAREKSTHFDHERIPERVVHARGRAPTGSSGRTVFFIHDGIKFPDFVHAVKPEPHNEIPQAASAHDTLWYS